MYTRCIQNLEDKTLVNGSVGKIVEFMSAEQVAPPVPDTDLADYQMQDGRLAEGSGHPDIVNGDAQHAPGGPPALSNVNIAQAALTDKEKLQQRHGQSYRDEPSTIPPGRWPVVEFKGGKRMLLPPMPFSLTNTKGAEEATRAQVPLILAWA